MIYMIYFFNFLYIIVILYKLGILFYFNNFKIFSQLQIILQFLFKSENIFSNLVLFEVLNLDIFKDNNEVQFWNIPLISFIAEVLKLDKSKEINE